MVSGLACHGHGVKTVELFHEVQEDGMITNSLTLIAALSVCSHAGLVDPGCIIFGAVKESYDTDLTMEHYG